MIIDHIYENASIHTFADGMPLRQKIGIHNGRIVGFDNELDGLGAKSTVDLGGLTVMPSFNDAHAHSIWHGLNLLDINLGTCTTLEEVYERISRAAAEVDDEWVIASGFNHFTVEGQYPDIDVLDKILPNRPLWIKHTSGHAGIVNSHGAKVSGISLEHEQEIVGGKVVFRHGKFTGLLEEKAMDLVQNQLLPYSLDTIKEALRRSGEVQLSEGITSVTDAGIASGWIGNNKQEFAAYQHLHERGELRVRAQVMLAEENLQEHVNYGEKLSFTGLAGGIHTGLGDDWLSLGPVKMFIDGSILGGTAKVTAPYCHCPGTTGYLQDSKEDMKARATAYASAGWSLAMHAVGDGGIDVVLEILAEVTKHRDRPRVAHRIEHGAYVRPDQLAVLANYGVSIVGQPNFISINGDGFLHHLGAKRAERSFLAASLLQARLPLAGSSDRPVAPGNPFAGIQALVQRLTPSGHVYGAGERVSVEQALRAYTVGSAQVTGYADRKGQLAPGYLGDFIVLSDDPHTVPAQSLSEVRVHATVVDGELEYEQPTGGASQ